MKKIILTLIAISSCASLMGMNQENKQITPITPPSFNPPPAYAPSAPYASTFEMVEIQNQRPQNNIAPAPQPPAQNQQEKATGFKNLTPLGKCCLPLLCIITGAFDAGTSPFCCLQAICDEEDDDHRPHSHFTHYFGCCTRKLLHKTLDEDTVCGINTNIPDNEKYVYEIRSGDDKMIMDGSGW